MASNITAAFEKVPEGRGQTAAEIEASMGMTRQWVCTALRRAIAAGRVRYIGKRKTRAVDGRVRWTPVYERVRKDR